MALLRRSILVLLLICLGCSAQSAPDSVNLRIERQVRSYYSIPADVKIEVSAPKPSEFPNFNALTITFDRGERKQNFEFLLSKDGKTLIRLTRFDLNQDPYAELMRKINVSGRPTQGNQNAKVVAVNYDDFECPFCSTCIRRCFPSCSRNPETGSSSSTRISRSSKSIPGPCTRRWTPIAWRPRVRRHTGISPTTSTPISRASAK